MRSLWGIAGISAALIALFVSAMAVVLFLPDRDELPRIASLRRESQFHDAARGAIVSLANDTGGEQHEAARYLINLVHVLENPDCKIEREQYNPVETVQESILGAIYWDLARAYAESSALRRLLLARVFFDIEPSAHGGWEFARREFRVGAVALAGLASVLAFDGALISGSAPTNDADYDALQALRVRTVLSVDGGMPDVGRARALGLLYVHLPVGYDGIDGARVMELARAVRDLPKPVYIHCHHGKHRGPAAAAAVCVTLGLLTNEQAIRRMEFCGTAPEYAALYRTVAEARPATQAELDAAPADFPETWTPTGLVQAMVEIDAAYDNLRTIEAAGWIIPTQHPDLVPAAEAGRLADLLRSLGESDDAKGNPPEFRRWLAEAATHSADLEAALLAASSAPAAPAELSEQLKVIAERCDTCHQAHRN